MITKTYLTKANSIFEDSQLNYGLNTISMIGYGKVKSRALIYFDVKNITEKYKDGTYPDIDKMKHVLKMTNCGSLSSIYNHKDYIPNMDENGKKERATSFDLLLIKIPQKWDQGVGCDDNNVAWINGKGVISEDGSNWYQSMNEYKWVSEEGIYSTETIMNEYEKYLSGSTSNIVGIQHFDLGNENLSIDISDYVNDLIRSEAKKSVSEGVYDIIYDYDDSGDTIYNQNYGLMIAFSPILENKKKDIEQYIGFFNCNTNTFFEPYLETEYDCAIYDDRYKFYLDKENYLYFFCNVNGTTVNCDEMPTCTINSTIYNVENLTKGVYRVKLQMSSEDYESNMILYDVWDNIKVNGILLPSVEMSFVTHSSNEYFHIGSPYFDETKYNVIITGINDDALLAQGLHLTLNCIFKIPYTKSDYNIIDFAEYRIYTMDGTNEIEVYPWHPINCIGTYNTFEINTGEMIPHPYYIDVKIKNNGITQFFSKIKKFTITNNSTNKKD